MYCWGCLIVTIKILVVLFFFFLWLVLRRRAGGWAGVVQCLLSSASVSRTYKLTSQLNSPPLLRTMHMR